MVTAAMDEVEALFAYPPDGRFVAPRPGWYRLGGPAIELLAEEPAAPVDAPTVITFDAGDVG